MLKMSECIDVILKGFNDEEHKTYEVGKVYLEDGWYSINDLQMVIKHLEKMNKINKLMMRKMNKDTHRCGYEGKWFEPKEEE